MLIKSKMQRGKREVMTDRTLMCSISGVSGALHYERCSRSVRRHRFRHTDSQGVSNMGGF